MKIVVAGYGPVGQAVFHALEQLPSEPYVVIDDPAKGFNYYRDEQIDSPDAVVVCVASPAMEDGRCDTSNVAAVLDKYYACNPDTKFLIKSAVDPLWLSDIHYTAIISSGTVDSILDMHYNLTYSPEFLGSSNMHRSTQDEFMGQTFAIYGGDDCRFWDELFKPVLSELKEVRYLSLEQAAFSKYVENCFLATRVTFFNEMYSIYKECGFEGFDGMIDAIALDPRIGKSHSQVPGPDGKFGYGGHCLPKDMSALRYITRNSPLLDAIVDANQEYRYGEK